MRQQTFATGDFERYRKPTRREQFLAEMNKVVSWDQLCALIEPYYPKHGNGRPSVGLEQIQHHETVNPGKIATDNGVENRFR